MGVTLGDMSNPVLDVGSISGSAKALVKGIALIDRVARSSQPPRQEELVALSGLPRSTVIRLVDVLCDLNVLRTDRNGAYLLGPRLASWGQQFINTLDAPQQGKDLLEGLRELTQETCFMGVLDGREVLYVVAAQSPQAVRPRANVGYLNPLHCTGIGKALLAFATPHERADLLEGMNLAQRTENSITDRAELERHLALVRERGYAIDDIENEAGVRCVAAPVYDHTGKVAAAISVSAPAYRFSVHDVVALAPTVCSVADQLSTRLGQPNVPATDFHAQSSPS